MAHRNLQDLLDDVGSADDQRLALGHAQRDVQHPAVLGDVDAVAAKHGVDAVAQP